MTNPPSVFMIDAQKKVVRKRSTPALAAERDVHRLKEIPETG